LATDAARILDDLQKTGAALRDAQKAYADLARAAAADPLVEYSEAEAREAARERRDRLLAHWSAAALAWLMRGGDISLVDPTGGTAGHIAGVAVPAAAAPLPTGRIDAPSMPRTIAAASSPTASSPAASPSPRPPASAPAAPVDLTGLGSQVVPAWARASQAPPKVEPVDPADAGVIRAPLAVHPGKLPDMLALSAELDRIGAAITQRMTSLWVRQPRGVQQALVGHIVARARHIQDELDPDLFDPARGSDLDRVFSCLTAFSKKEQPGFVFGLMRSHTPQHGSWDADARAWWVRLERELGPTANPEKALEAVSKATSGEDDAAIAAAVAAALDAGVSPDDPRLIGMTENHIEALRHSARFKKLRRAIRASLNTAESPAPAATTSGPPPDWAFWDVVRRKRAAVIGGDLREDARKRIQDAFEFSMLDWVTTDHARHIQVLAAAIQGGTIEFVILLRRFIGHDVDRIVIPACRAAGVPWISVDRGYGVNQITLAIERYRAADASEAAAEG
jgi:hypothetical protein